MNRHGLNPCPSAQGARQDGGSSLLLLQEGPISDRQTLTGPRQATKRPTFGAAS